MDLSKCFDTLDHELIIRYMRKRVADGGMKGRNYRIVRYADDILILCESRRSAEHVQAVATKFLEETLKLKVNTEKTHIPHCSEGVKFLGLRYSAAIRIRELLSDSKLHRRLRQAGYTGTFMKIKVTAWRNSA